jgi:hypothetical protein
VGKRVDKSRHDRRADALTERANEPTASVGCGVAYPHADDDVRVVGHDPGVGNPATAVVAGPRLAGHLPVPAKPPLVLVVLEDVGHEVGLGRRQDSAASVVVCVYGLAGAVIDLPDDAQRNLLSLVRKHLVALYVLEQSDLAATDRCRQPRV